MLEVLEIEDDFVPNKIAKDKPLCYYVMGNGEVEEQKTIFERPDHGMMYHLKPLFIRARVGRVTVNKVFVNGGVVVNLSLILYSKS